MNHLLPCLNALSDFLPGIKTPSPRPRVALYVRHTDKAGRRGAGGRMGWRSRLPPPPSRNRPLKWPAANPQDACFSQHLAVKQTTRKDKGLKVPSGACLCPLLPHRGWNRTRSLDIPGRRAARVALLPGLRLTWHAHQTRLCAGLQVQPRDLSPFSAGPWARRDQKTGRLVLANNRGHYWKRACLSVTLNFNNF